MKALTVFSAIGPCQGWARSLSLLRFVDFCFCQQFGFGVEVSWRFR